MPDAGGAGEREPYLVDRKALCAVLGVANINSITKMIDRGMPHPPKRGRFNLAECAKWYIEELHSRGAFSAEEQEEVVQARTELYRAQTEAKKLDISKARQELVGAADAHDAILALALECAVGWEQLPGRAASGCVGLGDEITARAELERHAREGRERTAERCRQLARRFDGSGAGDTPATETKRGSMG